MLIKEKPPALPMSPKSLKRINANKYGMSYAWYKVAMSCLILVTILVFIISILPGIWKLVPLAIIGAIVIVFWTQLRNDDMLENLKLSLAYYLRIRNNQTLILRHKETLANQLKAFLGILKIFPDGRIKYQGNIYYFLLAYSPKNISDDGRREHIFSIMSLLKSLPEENIYKFDMTAIQTTNERYEQQIIDAKNKPGISQPVLDHLHSIQDLVHKSTQDIEHEYLMMVSLGTFEDKEEHKSKEAMKTVLDGIEYQLKAMEIPFRVLTSPEEITLMYYNKISEGITR